MKNNYTQIFIITTEPGLIYQIKKKHTYKIFIPGTAKISSLNQNECMKLNTIKKFYNTLKYEQPEIKLTKNRQKKPINSIF